MGRTRHGADLIAEARDAGRIETRDFDIADLAAIQPGQRERRRALLSRLLGQRATGRPVPRYRGLRLLAAATAEPAGPQPEELPRHAPAEPARVNGAVTPRE